MIKKFAEKKESSEVRSGNRREDSLPKVTRRRKGVLSTFSEEPSAEVVKLDSHVYRR